MPEQPASSPIVRSPHRHSELQLQRKLTGARTADLIRRAQSAGTFEQVVVQNRGDGPEAVTLRSRLKTRIDVGSKNIDPWYHGASYVRDPSRQRGGIALSQQKRTHQATERSEER